MRTELPFTLKTHDQKEIFGSLKKSPRKTDTLIIFSHGLAAAASGSVLAYKAAGFFTAHGSDFAQFDFYHWGKGRRFEETTLTTQFNDLAQVIGHFRPKYKRIFVAGHSWGGLIVIGSRLKNVDGVLLWEPSAQTSFKKFKFKWERKLKLYKIEWDMSYYMSKKHVEEYRDFPKPAQAAKNLTVPTLVVNGSKGVLIKAGQQYFKNSPAAHKVYKCVKGAGHSFLEEGKSDELFKISLDFIKSVK